MRPFFQAPPLLTDTYRADVALHEHLARILPPDVLAGAEPRLAAMGEAAAGRLADLAAQAEAEEPRHVPYDAWGRRIDRIVTSAAWQALHAVQAEAGICGLPYGSEYGEHARVVQHALVHLYAPSSATYSCPTAMTDAAARVLTDHAEPALRDRVVPRLTASHAAAWTSGQWMTEREGGSDVSRSATVAQRDDDGFWTLSGTKWFTSATTADCALALARPVDADRLGLFLVERVDPRDGRVQISDTIRVNRLKDKLGTRSLPTAELTLDRAFAILVGPLDAGLRTISGMLNVTRAWNAMCAAAGMRRAVDLAVSYARVRESSGRRLLDLPLHRETLAAMAVEAEAAFALTLRVTSLMGRAEHGLASEAERRVLRALTPIAKLLTGKDAVAVASEALEAFGGAGYIEDTGLPALLRNAQVLPIWEGTTNVLSLDVLRAAIREDAVTALLDDVTARLDDTDVPALADPVRLVAAERRALATTVAAWRSTDPELVQAGAREMALRLGRCTAAALLCEHAAHRLAKHGDGRAAAVACRYAARWLGQTPPTPTAAHLQESLALLAPALGV